MHSLILSRMLSRAMADYELRDTARYFTHDTPYPYVSVSIKAGVCAWLMSGHVPAAVVILWVLLGMCSGLVHLVLLKPLRTRIDALPVCREVLGVIAFSSACMGLTWGAFTLLYFDLRDTTSVLMAGSVVAGTVGSAAAPLAIFLPAYYLIVVPTVLPLIVLLLQSSQVEHWLLAGLTLAFFASTAGYAHNNCRTQREGMRLRQENRKLIKDLKLRSDAAEAALQAKSLFLAGVSHDLKQPLRAIALFMGALRHRLMGQSDHEGMRITSKVVTALHGIHGQISRLLELSRLESGALSLHIQRVRLAELFAELNEVFQVQAQAKGLRLVFADTTHRRRGNVWTDRAMLDSVLRNFLSNAIAHTDRGAVYVGTRVRWRADASLHLSIEVRDSGAGIPLHLQPLLFDAYRSFDDRVGSDSHGLGLAIAKAQAQQLGCQITLRSAPAAGSTFTIIGLKV